MNSRVYYGKQKKTRFYQTPSTRQKGDGIDSFSKPVNWRQGFAGEQHMRTLGGYTYNFCGPGTHVDERIRRGDQGINALDEICKQHDIAYTRARTYKDIRRADRKMVAQTKTIKQTPSVVAARTAIKTKVQLEKAGIAKPEDFTSLENITKKDKSNKIYRSKDPAARLKRKFKQFVTKS